MTTQRPTAREWERPAARALLLRLPAGLGAFVPLVVIVVVERGEPGPADWARAWIAVGIVLLLVLASALRVLTTRVRVTTTEIEVRRGLLFRGRSSIRRDRVRHVDTTAGPARRLLRIETLRCWSTAGAQLTLAGLSTATAARLRSRLAASHGPAEGVGAVLLADRPRWMRYAPLTAWGVGGVGVLAGAAVEGAEAVGVTLEQLLAAAAPFVSRVPAGWVPWCAVVGIVLLGSVLAVATFVAEWHGFVLVDEGESLSVSRGLMTTRSLRIDRDRIACVEIIETFLTRSARAARVEVAPSGVGTPDGGSEADVDELRRVTPIVDRATAVSVASRIAGVTAEELEAPLLPRPPAARRRRVFEALCIAVAAWASAAVACLVWPGAAATAAAIAASVLAVSAVPLALAEHRLTGHRLDDRRLVCRSGLFVTRTTVIDRRRIVGFATRQSPVQRRRGLVTLTVALAAGGRSGVDLVDLSTATAAQHVSSLHPGVARFLHSARRGARPRGRRRCDARAVSAPPTTAR